VNELLQARRAARAHLDACDQVIANWDGVARSQLGGGVPPMEPSADDLELSATAAITVSTAWLTTMLDFLAGYDGPKGS
jgi:hypothetical protein